MIGRYVLNDFGDGRLVVGFQSTPKPIRHKLSGQALREGVRIALKQRLQFLGTAKRPAIGQRGRGVYLKLAVLSAPRANGVEVVQTETERVHSRVAGRAHRILAMLLQL